MLMAEEEKRELLIKPYDKYGNEQDVHELFHEKTIPNVDPSFLHRLASGGILTTDDIAKKPYKYHPWSFATYYNVAKNVSRLPLALHEKGDEENLIFEHPILQLLEYPNPLMTQTTFIQAIVLNLMLASTMQRGRSEKGGQAFLIPLAGEDLKDFVDLGRGQIPVAFLPHSDQFINAWRQKSQTTGLDSLAGWKFEVPGFPQSKVVYNPYELIRIFQYNPYNWLEGLANAHPAQLAMTMDIKSDIYNNSLYDNLAIPSGLLTSEDIVTDEQKKKALKSWYETYGGLGRQERIAVLGKGLKFQNIGLSHVDMEWSKQKADALERIIMTSSQNKMALGMYEDMNYATIREGRKMLWWDAYLPIAELITEAMNAQWVRYVDNKLRLKFVTRHIEALRPDYLNRSRSFGVMIDKGKLPPKVAAKITGIPLTKTDLQEYPHLSQNPLEWPVKSNAPAVPPSDGNKVVDEKVKQLEHKPQVKQGDDTKPIDTEAEYELFWRDFVDEVLDPGEAEWMPKLQRHFTRERNAMQDKVDLWLKKVSKDMEEDDTIKTVRQIDVKPSMFILDKAKEDKLLFGIAKPIIRDQLKRSKKRLESELGQDIQFNVTDDTVDQYLNLRKPDLRGVNTTTFNVAGDKIGDAIAEGLRDNVAPKQMAILIKDGVADAITIRLHQARTIARTETNIITGRMRDDAFKQEGFTFHEWINAADEKVRRTHRFKPQGDGGRVVRIGKRFPKTKLKHPGDTSGKLIEFINCRCVAVAAEERGGKFYVYLSGEAVYVRDVDELEEAA